MTGEKLKTTGENRSWRMLKGILKGALEGYYRIRIQDYFENLQPDAIKGPTFTATISAGREGAQVVVERSDEDGSTRTTVEFLHSDTCLGIKAKVWAYPDEAPPKQVCQYNDFEPQVPNTMTLGEIWETLRFTRDQIKDHQYQSLAHPHEHYGPVL